MRLCAPAKINWTLEVVGRRDDGYHEVRSVIQTVNLCDTLEITSADDIRLEVERAHQPPQDDLVLRAATLLRRDARGARIRLSKRVPVAAGLGGGSSDAASALRGLNELWRLGRSRVRLAEISSGIGSDVAFFVHGGTAFAEGRGERITPLPDVPCVWLVLLVPPLRLPEKTRRMYVALASSDFTDGTRTKNLLRHMQRGLQITDVDLYNAFERPAYEVFQGLGSYRDALLAAGVRRVHLAGSGPALFALASDEAAARATHARLRVPDGQALVIRTLTAAEARAVQG